MSESVQFVDATPVLASLNILRSIDFFVSALGFTAVYAAQGEYGIVRNGAVSIHFWACADASIPKATGCRLQVRAIAQLYQRCSSLGIVHPNAPLAVKPWGNSEFAILDPDGNLVTFYEAADG
ncbi:bleomycin resistance protein [Vogesella facilis]|uniref:Bleomycin resistance protein n=1 Tax=Vogesella facilis TaxID=1655232 RepID=A0ABV7RHA7_9NEIS